MSEPALEMLVQVRAPAPADEQYESWSPISGWARLPLFVLAWVAAAGLAFSLWVHVGALTGRKVAPSALFEPMGIGVFVVWIPMLAVGMLLAGSGQRKTNWDTLMKDLPGWMRYLVYGSMGYAVINFLLLWGQSTDVRPGAEPSVVAWRGVSGHVMAFYSVALAILNSAARAAQPGCSRPSGKR